VSRLTDYQRFKLEYWYCHLQEDVERYNAVDPGRAVDWNFYGPKATVLSMQRQGLLEDARHDGGNWWVARLTPEGELLAAELGAAKKALDEAERIVKESAPEREVERQWDQSLGVRHTHVNLFGDGEVSVHLHIRFASERAAEQFRLDMAGLLLKYRRRK
jgi:hypothetical protein